MQQTLFELAHKHDTDKAQCTSYLQNFVKHFESIRNEPLKVLEIGVLKGGSLALWHDYFPNAEITGIDLNSFVPDATQKRIRFYQGSQSDIPFLKHVCAEAAPNGFDIIIDDASHIGVLSKISYDFLFNHSLRKGGIYVIEDWGTGYWANWLDGSQYKPARPVPENYKLQTSMRSRIVRKLLKTIPLTQHWTSTNKYFGNHTSGMVGFVKELVDEVAWPDIIAKGKGNKHLPQRNSSIKEMSIYTGHCFLVKAE